MLVRHLTCFCTNSSKSGVTLHLEHIWVLTSHVPGAQLQPVACGYCPGQCGVRARPKEDCTRLTGCPGHVKSMPKLYDSTLWARGP